jgi:N4-gp56 family major capsid protein
MALGSGHVTKTTADKFIPEIWSDEIIAAYKKNLVAANLFSKMSFTGKKGDTLHIPKPTRGNASIKTTQNQVTLIADTEDEVQVLINKHYEYSRLIEDIVEVQALASLRKFYTDDAGYALGRQVDTDLLRLGRLINGGTWNGSAETFTYANAFLASDGTTAFDATANTNTGNEAAIADAGIRRSIQRLDDNDVPMSDRFFIVPPSTRNELMGLARFTEQAFVGEIGGQNTIRNGQIGDIYGVKVFVSTNCDTATTAGTGDVNPRIALLAQKDAFVLVEQLGVRSQTQYKQEYLGTLFTSDMLYGVKEVRSENAVALAVFG